jgi:hypothetical protein
MPNDLRRVHNRLEQVAVDLDCGRAQVDTVLRKLQDQVEQLLGQAPRVRRLRNGFERAAEDLSTARVLIDAALRQVLDQIGCFLAKAPDEEDVGQG